MKFAPLIFLRAETGPAGGTSSPDRPAARKSIPGGESWKTREESWLREYAEVAAVVGGVTVAGWFVPLSYHAFGHVYLLTVIALSVRVGRWPVLFAAVASAVAWNFVFIPPRLSFSVVDLDDSLLLATYFFTALIGGQLTARLRAEERQERQRQQRATAMFHLARALAAAQSLDEAATAALRQADELFDARTALLLAGEPGIVRPHSASSLVLNERESAVAASTLHTGRPAGRFTEVLPTADCLHLPMLRSGRAIGVFVVRLPDSVSRLTPAQRELIDGFSAQIALLVEREQLRAESERGQRLAESDRLHRTLLDSVSHELKTPLSVLRTAAEKLETDDARKRAHLVTEIRTATSRLDHLVANLLNQTKLESGAVRPEPDWCDFRETITAARRAVGDALDGHRVRIEVAPDAPLFLGDAALMEQVLANLLLNAARHTPRGGVIRVSAGLERASQTIFLAVADSGPGIPPDMQAHLFQKFHRGVSARPGGLGLGLSIVRGFMLAQGGNVTAGTAPEGGACFTVFLPHAEHDRVPDDEH